MECSFILDSEKRIIGYIKDGRFFDYDPDDFLSIEQVSDIMKERSKKDLTHTE